MVSPATKVVMVPSVLAIVSDAKAVPLATAVSVCLAVEPSYKIS